MDSLPADIKRVISGAQQTLQSVPGIGPVEKRVNPASPWSRSTGAYQNLWIVTHQRSQVVYPGGGAAFPGKGTDMRLRDVVVDGWMPYSFDLNTDEKWREILLSSLVQFTKTITLGVGAKMLKMPGVTLNRRENYTSLNAGDTPVLCHHGRIAFTVITHYPVSTR